MHDLRCEHSASDPKRCRCKCAGIWHGRQAEVRDVPDRVVSVISSAGLLATSIEQAPGVLTHDPVPPASNLGIHHWFEGWVTA